MLNRKAKFFRSDVSTGRLLHLYDRHWTICPLPGIVSTMLERVHDMAGYFGTKNIVKKPKRCIYWPHLVQVVVEYIQGCLQYAQFANAGKNQTLLPVLCLYPMQLLKWTSWAPSQDPMKETSTSSTSLITSWDISGPTRYPPTLRKIP